MRQLEFKHKNPRWQQMGWGLSCLWKSHRSSSDAIKCHLDEAVEQKKVSTFNLHIGTENAFRVLAQTRAVPVVSRNHLNRKKKKKTQTEKIRWRELRETKRQSAKIWNCFIYKINIKATSLHSFKFILWISRNQRKIVIALKSLKHTKNTQKKSCWSTAAVLLLD